MAENSLAMMPWFPKDFIAATRHLRLAERGAYRDLLDYQWEMEKLPNTPGQLSRLLGVSLAEFNEVWPAIADKFHKVRGGLVNKRLEEHRNKALQIRQVKRDAGSKGGRAKALARSKQGAGKPLADGTTSAVAKVYPPSPSPSPDKDIHTQRARGSTSKNDSPFEQIKAAYPEFSGRQDWIMAQHHCTLRIETDGLGWEDLLQAVERYAAYVAAGGVSSTQYVLTPAKFFSAPDEPWLQQWSLPVQTPRREPKTTYVIPDDDELAHA